MEGLSAAASVVAVLQISIQVYTLCSEYYLKAKAARSDIERLQGEVTALKDVLEKVEDLTNSSNSNQLAVLKLLNQTEGPFQQCQTQLTDLAAKLEQGQAKDKMTRFGLRALKWPLSSKDVDTCLETIGRHKATFVLALTLDDM